jgi:hypothetical protein
MARPIGKSNHSLFELFRLALGTTATYTTRPSHIVAFMGVIVELIAIFGQQLFRTTPNQFPKPELTPLSPGLIAIVASHRGYTARTHNRLESSPVYRVAAIIH